MRKSGNASLKSFGRVRCRHREDRGPIPQPIVRSRRGWRMRSIAPGQQLPIQAGLVRCTGSIARNRSEEHTSELQSLAYLVCRLLLEKKKEISAANAEITKSDDH